jgi:hypothetical protein
MYLAGRILFKEGFKRCIFVYAFLELCGAEAGQPFDHLVQLLFASSFAFHFCDVVGINGSEGHVGYSLVVLFGFFHGACFRLFLVARQIGLSIALHHFYFFFG